LASIKSQHTDPSSQPGTALEIDALIDYLSKEPIRVAVFGEFSAGKTTMLNALIGEEILSVAVEPTTAVPTRIRYAREFNIFIERSSGERLVLFEDDPPFWTRFVGRGETLNTLQKQKGIIQSFLRTWTKEGERAAEVERVIIELPLPWLKQGIELVDTPGVNNEFARHQGFTEQEARTTDIAVLLMDARQGGGKRTEFAFMNEVQRQVPKCIVALNKMDLVDADEREEFVTYVREEALAQHWDGAVVPPVVGLSALAWLDPEHHNEPALQAAFEGFVKRLERLAKDERGKLLLARRKNPEQELFAQARAMESEGRYDRAHRTYYDLLDILEAGGLDPTPAAEGIHRCEGYLATQVDTLDQLNARYNEVAALAADDPDSALKQLRGLRAEKADLNLEDEELDATITALQKRIRRRNDARDKIRSIRVQVERLKADDKWIEAAEHAQSILPLIEPAELPDGAAGRARTFVADQKSGRDVWATARWREIKAEADQCLNENRYIDASEHLYWLKRLALYTPFTVEGFARTVQKQAKTERIYRKRVNTAADKAEALTQKRVSPQKGRAIAESIEAIVPLYHKLYGLVSIPELPRIDNSATALTVDQKLAMSTRLSALSVPAPTTKPENIAESVSQRKEVIRSSEFTGTFDDALEIVEQYPDHPEAPKAIESPLEVTPPFWATPGQIRRSIVRLDEIHKYLPKERVDRQIYNLTRRENLFYIYKYDNHVLFVFLFFASICAIILPFSIYVSWGATLINILLLSSITLFCIYKQYVISIRCYSQDSDIVT
jgi:signal recognition particle receptor subunit beta